MVFFNFQLFSSLGAALIKYETVGIKYESSADLITSFDLAIPSVRNRKSKLANNTSFIVKDEITFEESKLDESMSSKLD